MVDIFTKEKRSHVMSLVKAKNTSLEKEVFKYLRTQKVYFSRHHKLLPGKPDVSIPSKKKAVFIDGDFWHGWHFSKWVHKLPNDFWKEKIYRNMARDKRTFAKLRRRGWKVMRVWSHQLKKSRKEKTLQRIKDFLTLD